THAAKKYIESRPDMTVLCITFRQSLAKYLAAQMKLDCYLDSNFWKKTADNSTFINAHDRCVVCLDHIYKLDITRASSYDLIVVDECVFVQYHFLGGTVNNNFSMVMGAFTTFLTEASKVIIMQQLPESTIAFYMERMSLTLNKAHPGEVVRKKVHAPLVLHPMVVTSTMDGLHTMTAHLASTYVKEFNVADNCSQTPIVIFTTRTDHAAILLYILRKTAEDQFGEAAAERIGGIWASVQSEEWNRQFLADPNTMVGDVDILITTSVLQAGHSLDRYFRVSYDFLFRGVLSFREEIQFVSRLRYLGRKDMYRHKYGWIPGGEPNRKVAGKQRIRLSLEEAWTVNSSNDSVNNAIYAPLRSEINDTYNRHYWLHKCEYRLFKVEIVNGETNASARESLAAHLIVSKDAIKELTKNTFWTSPRQSKNICILSMISMHF
ncbi:hypothetical protein V1511DRAFT_455084, partial [Dipodascopsis uninucleata]